MIRFTVRAIVGGMCLALFPAIAGYEWLHGERSLRSAVRVSWRAWLWTFTAAPGSQREVRLWKSMSEAEKERK
jgi:hypothetical protein